MTRDLPKRVYWKHGAFFWSDPRTGKWIRLGTTEAEARRRHAELAPLPVVNGLPALIQTAEPVILAGRAKNTQAQYRIALRRLRSIFAEFAVEDLKPKHVAQLRLSLAATPNMGNRILSVLRMVYDYALEQQLVDSNPCVGIKRNPERKRKRYLTDAEFLLIREHAAPRLRLMMDIAYMTGQRIGDVRSIMRRQITDEGIAFQQQKTDARLVVQWTDELRAAINAALALHGKVPGLSLFFTRGRRSGVPSYGTVRDQWRRACEAAKIEDAWLHDLRAKAATDARRQGKDARALLGHTDDRQTDRYIRAREIPTVTGPRPVSKKSAGGS